MERKVFTRWTRIARRDGYFMEKEIILDRRRREKQGTGGEDNITERTVLKGHVLLRLVEARTCWRVGLIMHEAANPRIEHG